MKRSDLRNNIIFKILLILNFMLLGMATNNMRNAVTNGYEVSIYNGISYYFWIILFLNIMSGISIVIYYVYIKDYKSNIWLMSLILLILDYVIIISLPIIKGYALSDRHDTISQLGTTLNILSTGNIDRYRVIYPAIHIIIVNISYVSNVEPMKIYIYLPIFFGIMFLLFVYVLNRYIFYNKGQAILAFVASIVILPTIGCASLLPNIIANLMLPLPIFLYIKSIKSRKVEYGILFLVVAFLFPILHPVGTIILILLIAMILSPIKLSGLWINWNNSYYMRIYSPIMILLVWGIFWWSPTLSWTTTVDNIYMSFIETRDANAFNLLENRMSYASSYGYSVWDQFFKVYGEVIIYIVFVFMSIYIIKKISSQNVDKMSLLYDPLVAFIVMMAILFGFNLSLSPYRIVKPILIICASIVGFTIYWIIEKEYIFGKLLRKQIMFIVIVILIVLSINGILKAYPSKYILTPNGQLTYSEINGMRWFLIKKDFGVKFMTNSIPAGRFEDLFLTPDERWQRGYDISRIGNERLPPYHFNYTNHTFFGESLIKDEYMITNKMDSVLYTELFPEMEKYRYSRQDFQNVSNDLSIYKLYSNGGLDVWYIRTYNLEVLYK